MFKYVVFAALLAVAFAAPQPQPGYVAGAPVAYSAGYAAPVAYSGAYAAPVAYTAGVAGVAAPVAYSAYPAYTAPVVRYY